MVTRNAKITSLSPQSIGTMFLSFHERLYHPLVLLSYAIEYRFAGLDPHVYHATSLAFHLLNTGLVFWFIYLLGGRMWTAFIVALLFGIHPMHVESVAWIPERKDVVYSFFFLGSLISYLYYLKKKDIKLKYASLVIFILSLLSKSMAMTLPLVLLLCDYLFGKKITKKSLLDKIDYFSLAVMFGVITIIGHYETGIKGREFTFSLIGNTMAVFQNIVFYLIKLVLPIKLSGIYPAPDKIQDIPQLIFILSPLIVFGLLYLVYRFGRKNRTVVFGSLFFLFTIAPVLQFLPVGLAVPADRYTYISFIGLFYMFAEGFLWFYGSRKKKEWIIRYILIALMALLMLWLGALTWARTQVYKDGIALWNDTIGNYKNIPLAYYNRAEEYFLSGKDHVKALADFNESIRIDPKYTESYINMGLIYYFSGDYDTAISFYNKAIGIDPGFPEEYLNRANSYGAKGMIDAAINNYNIAIKMRPTLIEAWYNRGNIYLKTGNYDKAISDYNNAIRLNDKYAAAYNNRGNVYYRMKEFDKAFVDFTQAIWNDPNYADAYYNRSLVYLNKDEAEKAWQDITQAKKLGFNVDPGFLDKVRKAAGR